MANAPAPTPIGFGLASVNALYWPMYVAQAKGFDKAEHLDLDLVQLGSSARVVQATVSGSIQIGLGSPDSVVTAATQGADMVMFAGNINKPIYGVIARPEIRGIEALRGKLSAENKIDVAPTCLQVTAGATHGFSCGTRLILEPHDEVLLLAPFWHATRQGRPRPPERTHDQSEEAGDEAHVETGNRD